MSTRAFLLWYGLGCFSIGSILTFKAMRLFVRMGGASVKILMRWAGVEFPARS